MKNSQPLSKDNHSPHVASANFSKGEAVSVIPDDITTINKLLDEIFLEIFDSYRRGFGRQHNYENIWNGKNGWFKARTCVPKLASRRACLTLPFTFAAYLRAALVSKGRNADSSSPLTGFRQLRRWNLEFPGRESCTFCTQIFQSCVGDWLRTVGYHAGDALEDIELPIA